MLEYIGLVGMICVVLAWIPQTLRTIRTKVVGMEPRFIWLMFFGSTFLAIYAYLIMDVIFLGLNFIATFFSFINIYYYYKYEAKMKKKAKVRRKFKTLFYNFYMPG